MFFSSVFSAVLSHPSPSLAYLSAIVPLSLFCTGSKGRKEKYLRPFSLPPLSAVTITSGVLSFIPQSCQLVLLLALSTFPHVLVEYLSFVYISIFLNVGESGSFVLELGNFRKPEWHRKCCISCTVKWILSEVVILIKKILGRFK